MSEERLSEARALAWQVRELAHAPYSDFKVGAVAITADGRLFVGCNVENLSFGLTNCAERVAIQTAVASGLKAIEAVMVVAETDQPISPCGACRQVMAEFGVKTVFLANRSKELQLNFAELFPRASTGILNLP